MFTLILAVLTGVVMGALLRFQAGWEWWSSIVIGILCMMPVQITIALIIRSRTKKINNVLQNIIQETQQKIQQRQNQMMRRNSGDAKQMMTVLEKEQHAGFRRCLEACNYFNPLAPWSFYLRQQVNSMRMMFYYQLKDFAEVDRLMPDCMMIDAQSISFKLARMYSNNAKPADIDKFFNKKCKRLKADNAILPYSLYAWILLKQDRVDDAFKLMTTAKTKSSNETILRNWECLANGKPKNFSNKGLDDLWYSLMLETPKMPTARQQVYRG